MLANSSKENKLNAFLENIKNRSKLLLRKRTFLTTANAWWALKVNQYIPTSSRRWTPTPRTRTSGTWWSSSTSQTTWASSYWRSWTCSRASVATKYSAWRRRRASSPAPPSSSYPLSWLFLFQFVIGCKMKRKNKVLFVFTSICPNNQGLEYASEKICWCSHM